MRIRGERECQDCGTRWTYYETGSVECPDCGSVHSVGVGDRTQHTDAAVELDLAAVQASVDEEPVRTVAGDAAEVASEYVRKRGFIDAGDLRTLDDEYLAAAELAAVGDRLRRAMRPDDDAEYYLFELLRAADAGTRPDPDQVPESLRGARGLAYADAVRDYRRELSDWEGGDRDLVARDLDRLETHVRRVRTLEGDVDPAVAETLVAVARDLGDACGGGGAVAETALTRARERLDGLRDRDRLD